VDVDQGVVAQYFALGLGDETHATHVRGEVVDFFDALDGTTAIGWFSQVREDELVGSAGSELRLLDVHPTDPEPLSFQVVHEVMTDKAARAGYKGSFLPLHGHEHPR
jgi:hypothetical protein